MYTNISIFLQRQSVQLKMGTANLHQPCDIMVDQLRTIDNKRLTKKIGILPDDLIEKVKDNIQIILDIE
ncbi:MAG: type II toxin-antitoxin system PemK/MazF family toxin [Bacteroidales bacterium]|nr:type II toxin-antitoxin system PemK/MazF family toxin [Bacteroidales bacterium]